ncbi:MAG: 50S ribosomal protein L18 [Atribacterota bacterium]|jgi:large subunit ribosomal protein L18|nr:50S ribosomal protein L18 [Atribacterota bacterium]MDD4896668.1 50S ribosomal protein L18 [Atribacterota bacterium]MDD5636415.1 50S ribosomal protein L18 [Atribacterota bacterium]
MENKKRNARLRRKKGIRKNVYGTSEKPRLSVFRSAKHIYVQAIDDEDSRTIVSISTLDTEVKKEVRYSGNIKAAEITGKIFNNRLKEKGIKKIVFDRNGYLYHGRVKALANQIKL